MCLEHCFNALPVKHGRDEEWREGICGENPGELKAEVEQLVKQAKRTIKAAISGGKGPYDSVAEMCAALAANERDELRARDGK